MATTAADILVDALCGWGVEVIFGLPGDGIKAAVPDDSPYTTGSIGLLGTKPSQEALETLRYLAHGGHLLILNINPQPGQAGAVGIDSDHVELSACAVRSK